MRALRITQVAAASVVTLAASACSHGSGPSPRFTGDPTPRAYTLPTTSWTDQNGQPYSFSGGKVTLVYFGYTMCPDICPTVVADEAAALRAVKSSVSDHVQVVMITSDPVRDTPQQLDTWLSSNFVFPRPPVGLTAAWAQIHDTATSLDVPLSDAEPKTVEEVGHGAQVVAFSPDGRSHLEWLPSEHLERDLVHDLPLLVAGRTA